MKALNEVYKEDQHKIKKENPIVAFGKAALNSVINNWNQTNKSKEQQPEEKSKSVEPLVAEPVSKPES